MPVWHDSMTVEDMKQNMEEYRRAELSRARRLRSEAAAFIKEAERIESLWRDQQP